MIAIGLSPEAPPGYPPGFFMPTCSYGLHTGLFALPAGLMGIASLHHILRGICFVGWVERSDTHAAYIDAYRKLAELRPPHPTVWAAKNSPDSRPRLICPV